MYGRADAVDTHTPLNGRHDSPSTTSFRTNWNGIFTPQPTNLLGSGVSMSPPSRYVRTPSEKSTSTSRLESHLCQVCSKKSPLEAQSLIECIKCHRKYHKGCHKPTIKPPFPEWKCNRCVGVNTSKRKLDKFSPSVSVSSKRLKSGPPLFAVATSADPKPKAIVDEIPETPEEKTKSISTLPCPVDKAVATLHSPASVSLKPHDSRNLPKSTRPDFKYAQLIAFALLEAPGHRLKVGQIYEWIAKNIPGYTLKRGENWKTGVSQSLTFNKKYFERYARDIHNSSKGGWWALRKDVAKRLRRWDPSMIPVSPKPSTKPDSKPTSQPTERQAKQDSESQSVVRQGGTYVQDISGRSDSQITPAAAHDTGLSSLCDPTAGAEDLSAGGCDVIEPVEEALAAPTPSLLDKTSASHEAAALITGVDTPVLEKENSDELGAGEFQCEHDSINNAVSEGGAGSLDAREKSIEHEPEATPGVVTNEQYLQAKPALPAKVMNISVIDEGFVGGSSPLSDFTEMSDFEAPAVIFTQGPSGPGKSCLSYVSGAETTSHVLAQPTSKELCESPSAPEEIVGSPEEPHDLGQPTTSSSRPVNSEPAKPVTITAPTSCSVSSDSFDHMPDVTEPEPLNQRRGGVERSSRTTDEQHAMALVRDWMKPRFTEKTWDGKHLGYGEDPLAQEEEDTEAKMAEISARPTRKQMFGKPALSRLEGNSSADRMAHIELGRQRGSRLRARSDVQKMNQAPDFESGLVGEVFQSLEELLDLPERMLPMVHETQLAFRDFTPTATGKLSRPKVIYKIERNAKG